MQGILLATGISLLFALLGTPMLIEFFRVRHIGQLVREDGPSTHFVKSGTPTMGGLAILVAATIGYFASHVRFGVSMGFEFRPVSRAALLVLAATWALGVLGAADDVISIRNRRSLGLNKRAKSVGQTIVGFALAYAAMQWVGVAPEVTWAGASRPPFLPALPQIVFAAWIVFIIWTTSNAVNVTDGLDGLASGSVGMCLFVFTVIAFWEFRNPEVYSQLLPAGSNALLEVSIVSASLLGACIGFLWWNAAPARIIMGDTGALALGGALASLALFTKTQLLLLVIGGLFAFEIVSVVVQVIARRVFDKRPFAMAPIHHHFELRGWQEITVVVRFWLVGALAAGLGLALFYMDFLASGGVG